MTFLDETFPVGERKVDISVSCPERRWSRIIYQVVTCS